MRDGSLGYPEFKNGLAVAPASLGFPTSRRFVGGDDARFVKVGKDLRDISDSKSADPSGSVLALIVGTRCFGRRPKH